MNPIIELVEKKGLILIEDAAQSLGSKFNGKNAGTFGLASAISFYPAKVMGCLGDGGAVLVNDPKLSSKIFQLHDHGRDEQGNVKTWGRNSRLDNIQAAILDFRLKSHDQNIARRRKIDAIYDERLRELHEIKLPPAPDSDPLHFDVYQNYEIMAENRDELKSKLSVKGVGTLVQWNGQAIHQIRELGFTQDLPHAEKFFSKCIMLPMNTFISDDDVHYVCDVIVEFYRS
jgi:UDP-2-acetamido-2-deoxy-ribo-hexuluronate aminotransferase